MKIYGMFIIGKGMLGEGGIFEEWEDEEWRICWYVIELIWMYSVKYVFFCGVIF